MSDLQHNLGLLASLSSIENSFVFSQLDAFQFLAGLAPVSFVYLDPPWKGIYNYDPEQSFQLSSLKDFGFPLISAAIQKSPVVAVKLPALFGGEELARYAAKNGLYLASRHQYIDTYPHCLNQSTHFFSRSSAVLRLSGRYGFELQGELPA
jgi:hypothetical protein